MKLEEIQELIAKAASMENNELVLEFKRASQFSNSLFNYLLDKDKKSDIMPSDIQSAFNFEIKSLIYENELKDRLVKGKEWNEYSIRLEYKNDDLNAEIKELRQKIANMQKPIEKETE